MKKLFYLSALCLPFLAGIGSSCNRQPETPAPITVTDTGGTQNRAVDVRKLSAEDVFLRIPKAAIEAEGLEKMDDKARKTLLETGAWGSYKLQKENNWISMAELPQNDDDSDEKTNLIQVAVFTKNENGYKHVLILKKQISESDKESELTQSKTLWEFDGKNWEDISAELPAINTALFFKQGFNLHNNQQDFIRLEPAANDPYQIKASLIYHLYTQTTHKLSERYLVDNEENSVSWFWNGDKLNLVVEPLTDTK